MNKRITWIDALKGWGILFMMYGHIEFAPYFLKQYTSPVMLMVFFLAAGYTFRSGQVFRDFFVKKVKTILWPWLVFALFNILLTQILTFSEQEPLLTQLRDLVLQVRGQTDGLWFFPCMFMALLLYYVIDKVVPNKAFAFVIHLVLLIISVAYIKNGGEPLPWHVQIWGPACFFMHVGNVYHFKEEKLRSIFTNKLFHVAMFIAYSAIWWLSRSYYPDTQYKFYSCDASPLFYALSMIFGVAWMLSLVQVLPGIKLIEYEGRNSLMYFAFHGKPKRLFTVLLQKKALVSAGNPTADLLFALADVVLLSIILVIPCEIVNRFFPFLLGKKKEKTTK